MAVYKPISRRFFLQGAGAALVGIPFLESLLPRVAWGSVTAPVRYVQVVASEGSHWKFWYGNGDGASGIAGAVNSSLVQPGPSGVYSAPLSKISGPMSQVLNTNFDALRGKMNVMMGLDACNVGVPTHVTGLSTTASVNPSNGGPQYALSADQVVAGSKVTYPNGSPQGGTPYLALCPTRDSSTAAEKNFTFSFNGSATPLLGAPSVALAQAFPTGGGGGNANAAASAIAAQKLKIVDQVKTDYDRVRQSKQISKADQQTLSNFMSLLSDLQNSYGSGGAVGSCTPPQVMDSETGYENRIKTMMNIAVAALACGSTNVVHIALTDHGFTDTPLGGNFNGGTYHDSGMHSEPIGTAADYSAGLQAYITSVTKKADALSYLLTQMNSIQESSGTLLDNSIVLYLGQMGAHGAHSYWGMPVVTAGGAGGAFATGNLLDYSQRTSAGAQSLSLVWEYEGLPPLHQPDFATGRPYNDLFTSVFHGLGIPKSDFQQPGNTQGGFGDYTGLTESNGQALSGDFSQRTLPLFSKT